MTQTQTQAKHTPGMMRAAKRIAVYWHDIDGASDAELQHVMDIIARETAAPELLEALRKCLDLADRHSRLGTSDEGDRIIEIALAAIAKASE